MLKKLVSMVVVAGLLVTCGTAFAISNTEKMQGKVTAIKGNVVTVKDIKGKERQFELNSAAGIKIGQNAWCEEDNCFQGLKIGDRKIKVKAVIGNVPGR
jgi:hypothetical protein